MQNPLEVKSQPAMFVAFWTLMALPPNELLLCNVVLSNYHYLYFCDDPIAPARHALSAQLQQLGAAA